MHGLRPIEHWLLAPGRAPWCCSQWIKRGGMLSPESMAEPLQQQLGAIQTSWHWQGGTIRHACCSASLDMSPHMSPSHITSQHISIDWSGGMILAGGHLITVSTVVQITISRGSDGVTVRSHMFKKEPSAMQFAPSSYQNGATTLFAMLGDHSIITWQVC